MAALIQLHSGDHLRTMPRYGTCRVTETGPASARRRPCGARKTADPSPRVARCVGWLESESVDRDGRIRDLVVSDIESAVGLLQRKILNLQPCIPRNIENKITTSSETPIRNAKALLDEHVLDTFFGVPVVVAWDLVVLRLLRSGVDHTSPRSQGVKQSLGTLKWLVQMLKNLRGKNRIHFHGGHTWQIHHIRIDDIAGRMHALVAVVDMVILHVPLVRALLRHIGVVKPVAGCGRRAPLQAIGSRRVVKCDVLDVLVNPIPLQHTTRLAGSPCAPVLHTVEHTIPGTQRHLEESRSQAQQIDPCLLCVARRGHALDEMIAVERRTVTGTRAAALAMLALGWCRVLSAPAGYVTLDRAAESSGVDLLGVLGSIMAQHARKPVALTRMTVKAAVPPATRPDPLHRLDHVGRVQLRRELLLGLRGHRKQNIVEEA
mmetsp:Transcript_13905/g.33590  ORF Transcript_13905/g.33590 Transcript_13905/m.33590 type:complete len:433 (-) Transcript_13905:372-1670(-)